MQREARVLQLVLNVDLKATGDFVGPAVDEDGHVRLVLRLKAPLQDTHFLSDGKDLATLLDLQPTARL